MPLVNHDLDLSVAQYRHSQHLFSTAIHSCAPQMCPRAAGSLQPLQSHRPYTQVLQ